MYGHLSLPFIFLEPGLQPTLIKDDYFLQLIIRESGNPGVTCSRLNQDDPWVFLTNEEGSGLTNYWLLWDCQIRFANKLMACPSHVFGTQLSCREVRWVYFHVRHELCKAL